MADYFSHVFHKWSNEAIDAFSRRAAAYDVPTVVQEIHQVSRWLECGVRDKAFAQAIQDVPPPQHASNLLGDSLFLKDESMLPMSTQDSTRQTSAGSLLGGSLSRTVESADFSFIASNSSKNLLDVEPAEIDHGPAPLSGMCRIWEGMREDGSIDESFSRVSLGVEKQSLILCALLGGRWCPLSADRASRLGLARWAQGHAVQASDYSNALKFKLSCAKPGDPTNVYIQTVDKGAHLGFVKRKLCERALWRGSAGPLQRLQLLPDRTGNPYVFFLCEPSSRAINTAPTTPRFHQCLARQISPRHENDLTGLYTPSPCNSSVAHVCFDEPSGCFVQCSIGQEHQPVVFAFQSVASAKLIDEITYLEHLCAEQKAKLQQAGEIDSTHERRTTAHHDIDQEHSESEMHNLVETLLNWESEESHLVFLQDSLLFMQDQLNLVTRGPFEDDIL